MSWMRLCQSVTASADIALFVGGRARSLEEEGVYAWWREKGFEKEEEEEEGRKSRRREGGHAQVEYS